jgi:outer membrane lipoprotein SlyB
MGTRRKTTITILMAATAAVGCANAPTQPSTTPVHVPPPPQQVAEVYVYPSQGQSEAQLDRDRYECHLWSVRQSGFDPSLPGLPPQQRVRVVQAGPPPGATVVAGAMTGAVVGAVVSNPRHSGDGALVGAAAGAILGAIAEDSASKQAQQVQSGYDDEVTAEQERRAQGYRRAITACLTGRGYSVR